MVLPVFAALGALLALPTRLLARSLVCARTGGDGSRIPGGKLSTALFLLLSIAGWSLIAAVVQGAGVVVLFLYACAFQVMLCLSAVDLAIRRIPNELLLALLPLFLIGQALHTGWGGFTGNLLGAVIATALFLLPSKMGMNVGWGDVKYAAVIGLCLGLTGFLQVTLVMALAIGVYAAYLYLFRKGTVFTKVALGPYLSLGALTAMVFPVLHTVLNQGVF